MQHATHSHQEYLKVEKLLTDTIDAEFMKNGFKASNHAQAVLRALEEAGYRIIKHEPSSKIPSSEL